MTVFPGSWLCFLIGYDWQNPRDPPVAMSFQITITVSVTHSQYVEFKRSNINTNRSNIKQPIPITVETIVQWYLLYLLLLVVVVVVVIVFVIWINKGKSAKCETEHSDEQQDVEMRTGTSLSMSDPQFMIVVIWKSIDKQWRQPRWRWTFSKDIVSDIYENKNTFWGLSLTIWSGWGWFLVLSEDQSF